MFALGADPLNYLIAVRGPARVPLLECEGPIRHRDEGVCSTAHCKFAW